MATSNQLLVTQLYVAYFNRPADAAGLAYWTNALDNGATVASMAAAFAQSSEAQAIYPYLGGDGSSSSVFFISDVYNNLLGRPADSDGLAYWMGLLQTGAVTPAQVVATMVQTLNAEGGGSDAQTLTNKVQAALDYTQSVGATQFNTLAAQQILHAITDNPGTLANALGQITAITTPPVTTGSTTVFTTGVDHLTPSDSHTINAKLGPGATLTANDSLHGSGNSLDITDSGSASHDVLPTGFSLAGVPIVTLTTSGNAGADSSATFDLSPFSGVSSLSVESSGTHGDFITVGSGVSVSVTQHAAIALAVSGDFDNLTVTNSSLISFSLSGDAGDVTLLNPGGTSLTVDVSDFTTTGFHDFTDHITSLTFSGAAEDPSTIKAIFDSALTSITLSDGVALGTDASHLMTLGGNVTTVSGGGDDSASYIAVSATNATVTLGDGDNTVSLILSATGANLTLGDGNNTVTDNVGGATITVGAGNNTIDLGSHGNDTVIVGPDGHYNSTPNTPNQVIQNAAAGDVLIFANILSGATDYTTEPLTTNPIAQLLADLPGTGNPGESSVIAGIASDNNTYFVATDSLGSTGPTHISIVELVGAHLFTLSGGQIQLTS